MPRLRVNVPLWLERDSPARHVHFPSLRRGLTVDVAIVGAGVTGAAVAWRFTDAGIRVAVVDAAGVGRGSTAASTALLMQEPDEDFRMLSRQYGTRRAQRIWELSREATREFVHALTRLRIPCDLAGRDSVYYAETENDAHGLRVELRHRTAAGIRGLWLEGRALRRVIGFDAPGAIRTRGNAQVDPFKACAGLLRVAAKGGAHIFERSPVQTIRSSPDGVVLETPRGAIRANRVVIATGYATPYFKPLEARFRMLNTYVIATRPLTPSERRGVALGPVMLWDTGRPYHYARWTPDHRLLFGGGDRRLVPERQRASALEDGARGVHEHFLRLYPALADVELEYRWEGLFATTPDGLPYIGPHRRYPRHLFALGYGGNGMTFGFLAARLLLALYRGDRTADHALFAFSR
jgi:glycine/D-amino acid oxidase-like deaminating enzyme